MSDKDYTDLIHRYLVGDMSPGEKNAFLKQVEKDQYLSEELDLMRDIRKGIELHGHQRLKAILQDREKKHQAKPKPIIWKVAASLFIALGLGYSIFQFYGHKGDLYKEYYLPYPNVVNPISRSAAPTTGDGITYYEQEQYSAALDKLLKQLKEEQDNDTVKFYLAQTYLALDKSADAITYLRQVEEKSRFYEPAQWYLALTHLKNENIKEARTQLKLIIASQSSYSKEASELLDQL
ncbi:hypothetical protein JMN32_08300 [Fulvivirga sp. 29W222]|uniref:Tetratricopeptide repeat protein n=1 Tax=Fulvivirga marina TaxID=2494733 RepID=A0A937G0L2_9BACT|nr:hypothetical protein [Fulvivirga marina]MBL6446306.1 hypothetical protein [Fulvivirga marina]